jgi:hypothetical protein
MLRLFKKSRAGKGEARAIDRADSDDEGREAPEAELYRSTFGSFLPLGPDRVIATGPRAGPAVLSRGEAELLARCRGFKSLEEHVTDPAI